MHLKYAKKKLPQCVILCVAVCTTGTLRDNLFGLVKFDTPAMHPAMINRFKRNEFENQSVVSHFCLSKEVDFLHFKKLEFLIY